VYPLETYHLTKIYRKTSEGVEGIENVNIKVSEGEIIAILGPNGAGKTTFIKMVCSQIRPDKGTVLMDGISIWDKKEGKIFEIRRRVGYAPEVPFFYAKLTGWELARFMESIYDYGLEEGGSLSFKNISDAFSLTPHLNKLVSSYSHGTLRKLILAFAISFGTRLIVLDEPSNGLDPTSYLILRDILRECRTQGRAILLSTHQLSMAQEIADYIAIFFRGNMKCFVKNDQSVERLYMEVVGIEK